MVLGLVKTIGIISSCLFVLSCVSENSVVLDEVTVSGKKLQLVQVGEKIALRIDTLSYDLSIESPCFFGRNEDMTLRSFAYLDIDVLQTILVIGKTPTAEEVEKWDLKPTDECGSQVQGIVLKKDSTFYVNPTVLSGGISCKNSGLDEKLYWMVAHDGWTK